MKYQVWVKLSFKMNRTTGFWGRFEIGNGSAGYCAIGFDSAVDALNFARSLGGESQMPCHKRTIAELEKAVRS